MLCTKKKKQPKNKKTRVGESQVAAPSFQLKLQHCQSHWEQVPSCTTDPAAQRQDVKKRIMPSVIKTIKPAGQKCNEG